MDKAIDKLSSDLDQRIEALENGRSLAWQERWIEGVQQGLDDADAGRFASESELDAVLKRVFPEQRAG